MWPPSVPGDPRRRSIRSATGGSVEKSQARATPVSKGIDHPGGDMSESHLHRHHVRVSLDPRQSLGHCLRVPGEGRSIAIGVALPIARERQPEQTCRQVCARCHARPRDSLSCLASCVGKHVALARFRQRPGSPLRRPWMLPACRDGGCGSARGRARPGSLVVREGTRGLR